MAETAKPKIYAFIAGKFGPDDVTVIALAEDGAKIASHVSSSASWARHDIGVGSDWQHSRYAEHYPDGYDLEWIDHPDTHPGVAAAILKAEVLRG